MINKWTKIFGKYQGNETVNGDMISRPCNEWGSIDSNTKHYKVIYRANDNSSAKQILDEWKNEVREELVKN